MSIDTDGLLDSVIPRAPYAAVSATGKSSQLASFARVTIIEANLPTLRLIPTISQIKHGGSSLQDIKGNESFPTLEITMDAHDQTQQELERDRAFPTPTLIL